MLRIASPKIPYTAPSTDVVLGNSPKGHGKDAVRWQWGIW